MPKDPSFDRYLDEEIEEHSKDEPHDEYCEEEGCAECEEEEDVPTSDCPIWKLKETLEKLGRIMEDEDE